jgi:RNA polymerase sigma factor (sigma-70 family)
MRHLSGLTAARGAGDLPDHELMRRFVACGDEQAFAGLLRRHGPLVLRVCRHVLRHDQDAEDAFQATFLILARKAGSVCKRPSVGSWLHGVAYRVARKARDQGRRRHFHEGRVAGRPPGDALADVSVREAQAMLDEELARLPEKYRAPFVLCCLEGQARDEAARRLGWSLNRLKSRLEQARALLRDRLARRGLALSLPLVTVVLARQAAEGGVPGRLIGPTAAAARLLAAGAALPAGLVPAPVAGLVKHGLRDMLLKKLCAAAAVFLTLVIAAGAGLAARPVPPDEPAAEPKGAEAAKNGAARPPAAEPLPAGAVARLGSPWFRVGGPVMSLTFAADGKTVLAANLSLVINRWDVNSGKALTEFKGHTSNVVAVALSPDGSLLASGASDNTVRVWRVKTGEQVWSGAGHKLQVTTVAFSPDGKTLATSGDQTVRLWDVAKGEQLRQLPVEGQWGMSVAFSPDGKTLAVAGDGGLDLWDVAAARKLPRPDGKGAPQDSKAPQYGYHSVTFSPDGKALAAGARGQTVEVWDVATGKSRWRKALGGRAALHQLRRRLLPGRAGAGQRRR